MFRRSTARDYEKSMCFLCDECCSCGKPLHKVTTEFAGKNLKAAVDIASNDKSIVHLSFAIDPTDAHAIDMVYYKHC